MTWLRQPPPPPPYRRRRHHRRRRRCYHCWRFHSFAAFHYKANGNDDGDIFSTAFYVYFKWISKLMGKFCRIDFNFSKYYKHTVLELVCSVCVCWGSHAHTAR